MPRFKIRLTLLSIFYCAAGQPTFAAPDGALPLPEKLGFWSPTEQEFGYRAMERIFPTHTIRKGSQVYPLPMDPAGQMRVVFDYKNRLYTSDEFMSLNRTSGLLIVKDGKVLLEQYGLGRKPQDRWTSFSIAKSVTSTLLGAAVQDGAIGSLDDRVVKYLPQLKGSAYDGTTIRQLLTMSSGVKWNENYDDPESDFNKYAIDMGDGFLKVMASMPRAHTPGETFSYSTGEANIIGAIVMAATKMSLSDYLSEKIWAPFGMEQDGIWITSRTGQETGGICFSATLHDYARLGIFMMADGMANGKRVLPVGWVADATRRHRDVGRPDWGYGYQWWTMGDHVFAGFGIMGQALYVDMSRQLVIVVQGAWPAASDPSDGDFESAFFKGVTAAVDARRLN